MYNIISVNLNSFMKCNKAVSIFIQTQVSIAFHALDV